MLRIETIRQEHIEGIHRAFDAVAREGLYFSEDKAMALNDFTRFMEAVIGLDCPRFAAVSPEGVVGWSLAHRTGHAFSRHSGTLFLGLLPEWRGQGIGHRLLKATLDQAWESGLTRIGLEVYADNRNAIALYRRMGFTAEGLLRRAHVIDGRYRDVACMAAMSPVVERLDMPDMPRTEMVAA